MKPCNFFVSSLVMPGLVPGIHVFLSLATPLKAWKAGTSPAMTL
jgi:hypothetical protein